MASMKPPGPPGKPDLRRLRWLVPLGACLVFMVSASAQMQALFLAPGETLWRVGFAWAVDCTPENCVLYEVGVRVLSALVWLAAVVALTMLVPLVRGPVFGRLRRVSPARALVGLLLLAPLSALTVGTAFGWVLLAQGDLLHWLFTGAGLLYGIEAVFRLGKVSVSYLGSFNDSSVREHDLRVWVIGLWLLASLFWLLLLSRELPDAAPAERPVER